MSETGRYGRKCQIIIGETNGDPRRDHNMHERLGKMLVKLEGAGEEIPEAVRNFVADNDLGDSLRGEINRQVDDTPDPEPEE